MGAFEDFVNTELPLRPSLATSPGAVRYPRLTGVGKALEARTAAELLADIGAAASGHAHAITDLSDVSAKTGGGTTVVFDTSPTISTPTISGDIALAQDVLRFQRSGETVLELQGNASYVNFVQLTGGPTGYGPLLSASGDDASVHLDLQGKGSGRVRAYNNSAYREVVTISGAQTLTDKTLTAPTIGGTDFANATHDHSVAANGGLPAAKLRTVTIVADIPEPEAAEEWVCKAFPYAATFVEMYLLTSAGTVDVMVEKRSRSTGYSAGTDMFSAVKGASTTGGAHAPDTTAISADDVLVVQFSNPGSVGRCMVILEATIN